MPNRSGGPSRRCQARTKAGKPCPAPATKSGYCNIHSGAGRAAELGRLGGLNNRYLQHSADDEPLQIPQNGAEIRQLLAETMAGVKAGRVDPKIGTALAYIATPLLKAIEVGELEARVKELESESEADLMKEVVE
jgi:hypothetical protein